MTTLLRSLHNAVQSRQQARALAEQGHDQHVSRLQASEKVALARSKRFAATLDDPPPMQEDDDGE